MKAPSQRKTLAASFGAGLGKGRESRKGCHGASALFEWVEGSGEGLGEPPSCGTVAIKSARLRVHWREAARYAIAKLPFTVLPCQSCGDLP